MSLPLRNDQTRNSVLNIFPDAPGKEKPRAAADFRSMARVSASVLTPEPAKMDAPTTAVQRNSHSAFDLLDQASNVIPVLMARCRQLESDLNNSREKARSEMEAAELVAQRYQTIIQELQAKIKSVQGDLQAMGDRATKAESQTETIQITADRTRQHAAEAECLTALFHDKVMAALGNDSPAHAVLQAMRQATAQAAPAVTVPARGRVA